MLVENDYGDVIAGLIRGRLSSGEGHQREGWRARG